MQSERNKKQNRLFFTLSLLKHISLNAGNPAMSTMVIAGLSYYKDNANRASFYHLD